VDGARSVAATATGLRVELSGSPAAVLRVAADAGLSNVRSSEASLEEIFLTYYGDTGSAPPRAGAADVGR
jgi:hypothetical protein